MSSEAFPRQNPVTGPMNIGNGHYIRGLWLWGWFSTVCDSTLNGLLEHRGYVLRVCLYRLYMCISCSIRVLVDSCKQTPVDWNLKKGLCAQECLHVCALYTTLHTGYVNLLYKALLYIDYIYVYAKYMYIKQYTVQCAQGKCQNIAAWV